MRSANRITSYDNIQDLVAAAKKIAHEEHRQQFTVTQIVTSALGNAQTKGLIPQRIEYYHKKSPVNWAEELDAVTRIFSPNGELLAGPGGIIATADYTTSIDPKILPKSVLDQFSGQGDKSSTMLKSLKRELVDKYTINIWQWFWANLAHALVTQPEPEQKRTLKEDEEQDEFFYLLSRNPYLIIARKALHHSYRKDSFLLQRVRGVFELYIIEELLFATRRDTKVSSSRYLLKSQCLAMMFLLIHSRKGKLSGPTMEIYQEWFLKATEYYSTISSQSHSYNIRNLIRVWVYLLTREHSLDSSLVKQLENANPRDGWYRLSRCPLHSWAQAVKKVSFYSQEIPSIISVRKNIFRLLSKHSQWSPSFSFLATLEAFLQFDQHVLQKYIRRQGQRQEFETVARCFERILVNLAESGANCQSLQKKQLKLNERYKDKFPKKISVNFAERSQEAKQKLSRSSREQLKSISYQSPRIRNVWEHPLQENEYYILFTGAYWVSRQLDRLIPGHSKRSYPCINIRILSNPLVFLLLFLVATLAVRTLLLE